MIYFHMQRLKFTDFMVIELRFLKKKKEMENMTKIKKALFLLLCTSYIFILISSKVYQLEKSESKNNGDRP